MVIKDRFTLGTISGLCGSVPQILFLLLAYGLHLMNHRPFEIAGAIFIYPHLANSFSGTILAFANWLISAAVMGVCISFLISWTGKDFWWVKGLVFNLAVMFIFIYGFLYDFGSHVVPQDRPTNIVILLSNIIFSIVTSYLIIRWSPNSKETTN